MRRLGVPLVAALILLPASVAAGRGAEYSLADPSAPIEPPPVVATDAAPSIAIAHIQHGPLVRGSITVSWPSSKLRVDVLASSSALGEHGSRQVRIGSYAKTVGAGAQAFSVTLSETAVNALRGTGQLPVTIRVKVTPATGTPFKTSRKATLILLA